MTSNIEVELYFSCKNLPKADLLSKSDPYFKLYTGNSVNGTQISYSEVFTSETKKNNNDPVWEKPVKLKYFFEERQNLKIEIYDSESVLQDKVIAVGEFVLANVIGSRGKRLQLKLNSSKKNTVLIVKAEEIPQDLRKLSLQVEVEGVPKPKKLGFISSDPNVFFKLYAEDEKNTEKFVYESEQQKGKNCGFKKMEIVFGKVENKNLKFRFYDSKSKKQVFFSEVNAEALQNGISLDIKKPNGNLIKGAKLSVVDTVLKTYESVLNFFDAGLQINCLVAIDCTGSNEMYGLHSPEQNHFLQPGSTPYQRAINSVGRILLDYDSDKEVPFFGFGAVQNYPLPPINKECFALNLNEENPNVYGLEGMHSAYAQIKKNFSFAGPTFFAPLIKRATAYSKKDPNVYTVLILLTDGQNDDMDETIAAIFEAAEAPLSIVIVGIGPADFTNMKVLDGDEDSEFGRLTSDEGKILARDLVQFVSFREFDKPGFSIGALAAEVLAEVPNQISEFYYQKGIVSEHIAARIPEAKIQVAEVVEEEENPEIVAKATAL
eukprot:maker-scaffold_10-snap-gene-5.5-mRNA-1 protein AED:0.03 eAED:0.03 QI:404/1/1/1/1/1/5/134/546